MRSPTSLLLLLYSIASVVYTSSLPQPDKNGIIELTKASWDTIVMDPTKDVIVEFYSPRCGYCIRLVPVWEELGRQFKDEDSVIIAKIDGSQPQNKIEGHNIQGFPTIKMFPASNKEGIEYNNHHRTLSTFVEWVLENSKTKVDVAITYKSEDVPESNDGPVLKVVGKTFKEIVLEPHRDVLVNFYAPWCPYSVQLTPTWQKLGERFSSLQSLLVVSYDDTQNDVPGVHVHAYPTVMFYPAEDKENPHTFRGHSRTEDSLAQFAAAHASIPFKDPKTGVLSANVHKSALNYAPLEKSNAVELTDENFNEVVRDETKNTVVMFYAPWCEHSQELFPIWNEIAIEYQFVETVTIAKMDATAHQSGKHIRIYPTIGIYPSDPKADALEYRGKKNLKDISEFIMRYSSEDAENRKTEEQQYKLNQQEKQQDEQDNQQQQQQNQQQQNQQQQQQEPNQAYQENIIGTNIPQEDLAVKQSLKMLKDEL